MMMPVGRDQPCAQQRRQRQDRRRRIAAGIGHELGAANPLAVQLRQAVDGLGQPRGVGMLVVVPLGVDGRVVQPIVGAQVDDAAAGGQQRHDRLGARRVRQATEDAVGPLGDLSAASRFSSRRSSRPRSERMHVAEVRLAFLPRWRAP